MKAYAETVSRTEQLKIKLLRRRYTNGATFFWDTLSYTVAQKVQINSHIQYANFWPPFSPVQYFPRPPFKQILQIHKKSIALIMD